MSQGQPLSFSGEIPMATGTIKISPQAYARIDGVLYLLIIVGGMIGPILRNNTVPKVRGEQKCGFDHDF